MEKKIVLKVDGREIAMNAYVKKVFTNVIDGLVESLDGIPADKKKVEIVVE